MPTLKGKEAEEEEKGEDKGEEEAEEADDDVADLGLSALAFMLVHFGGTFAWISGHRKLSFFSSNFVLNVLDTASVYGLMFAWCFTNERVKIN